MAHISYAYAVLFCCLLAGCSENQINLSSGSEETAGKMRQTVLKEWQCTKKKFSGKITYDQLTACPLHTDVFTAALTGHVDEISDSSDNVSKTKKFSRIANIYFFAFDTSYFAYEQDLLGVRRAGRTVPALLSTVLPIIGLSGNVSGTELGAAALFTNLWSDVQSGFLEGQTLLALSTKMREDRLATQKTIEDNIKNNISSYELNALMRDLVGYHQAGTLENALRNFSSDITGQTNADNIP